MLIAQVDRNYDDCSSLHLVAANDTPSAVIESIDQKVSLISADHARDVADGLAALFDALETAELPPAAPAPNPVDLRVQVGPTDV